MHTKRRITATAAMGIGIVVVAGMGVATATNGKPLLLGKSNSATRVTTLSDSKGTPLSLKAPAGKPPLAVSNSVQVPKLNSSLLGGHSASSFQHKVIGEQCSQQPGSYVTGLTGGGTLSCDNGQAVKNGLEPPGGGAPQLSVPFAGKYLVFGNVALTNASGSDVAVTCQVTWLNTGAVSESADQTYATVPPNTTSDDPYEVALGTSGAQQIDATTIQLLCSPTSVSAVQEDSGDLTAMPVSFN